ncbi:MAG: hypothetical protein JWM10_219 [Myxococcaceae bacterium]|nr:hypothetical protein [Myxococcaceae bacterium]
MLEQLDSVPWSSLPQPPWNRPTAVPDAIRELALASSEEAAGRAYNAFLYAVGNNHAGTYFPVVLRALPFLGEILRHAGPNGREATLDVLVDLAGSFEPDPEYRLVATSTAREVALQDLVYQAIAQFAVAITALAVSEIPETRAQRLAAELLELLAGRQGAA